MKKNILILMVMLLLFTGCNKDEMSNVNNNDKVKVQDNVVDDNKSITDSKEEVIDNNSNEVVVEQAEEVTATTTTTTTTATKKVTTKKTTKKVTTSKVTTTVKSETTTTTKKVEEEIAFYIPVGGVTSYYIDSSKAKYPYSVFFNGSGNSIYSTAKGKISRVFINDRCKFTLDDKDNLDLIFADIIIYHKQNLYSVYRCVKDPVFSNADIGKEVTENTVIGYIGKHSNSAGVIVSAFGFSFQNQPRLDLYYSSLSKIVIEPSLYIEPFRAKRSGYVSNRNVR